MATPSFGSGAAVAQGHEENPEHAPSTAADDPESRARHAEIERRAYYIYLEERGGDPEDHWYRAERELDRAGPT